MCNLCLETKQNITKELETKLRLERTFSRIALKEFNSQARKFKDFVAATGTAPTADVAGWQSILQEHYERVRRAFRGETQRELKQIEDDSLNESILALLLLWESDYAQRQGELIAQTNAIQMRQSVIQARSLFDDVVSNREISLLSTRLLMRKFRSRIPTIAMSETLTPAENIKNVEATQTSAQQPETFVVKDWVTVGGDLVRASHREANGQTVAVNDNFTVNGFQLAYPGDSQFGAPLDIIINCRCSANYRRVSRNEFFAIRNAA